MIYKDGNGNKFVKTGEFREVKEMEHYLSSSGETAIQAWVTPFEEKFILKPYVSCESISLYRRCLNWFKTLKG